MEHDLEQMICELMKLDCNVWYNDILTKSYLYKSIKKLDMEEIIIQAIDCGKQEADKVLIDCGLSLQDSVGKIDNDSLIKKIAQSNNLILDIVDSTPSSGVLTFATFSTPNLIMINHQPIEKSVQFISNSLAIDLTNNKSDEAVQSLKRLLQLILFSHELFHFIEQKNAKTIYTLNKKIVLWRIFGFKYTSTVRAISEIAAAAFVKQLCKLDYCPLIIDVLLSYYYNQQASIDMYKKIVNIN